VLVRVLCVLLLLAWTAERNGDPLLFNGTWRSPMQVFAPLFDSLPLVHQPAWNLLLVLLAPLCHLRAGAFRGRAWPIDAAILLSLGTIAATFSWGVARGGSAYWAYYQLNALLLTLFVGALLLAAVQSRRDLRLLGMTIVAAALLRSLLALYYFFAFVRGREPYPPHMTSHDDSMLFVAGIIVILIWALVRRRWQPWLVAAVVILPILLAVKVNNRRVAWLELAVALALLYLVMPDRRLRRRLNRWMVVAAPVLAVYVAVGWGRPGPLFTPLRAFGSTVGETDNTSTLARKEENLNIILTYIQNPILGSGWGHPMKSVSSYYAYFGGGFDEMYPYTPHNSLAALVAFTGVVGLFGILGVIPVTAFLAARAARFARRPLESAAAMAAICYLPVYGLHAFADIGLQVLTGGLLLSVALAVAGRVSVWTGAWPARGAGSRRREPRARPAPWAPATSGCG
jgi:hypothetical protein